MEPVPDCIALTMAKTFRSSHLTHDEAADVEPEAVDDEVRQGDLASLPTVDASLARPRPGLERQDALVSIGELVQVQLVLGLERGDAFQRRDLCAQGPNEGGLAGSLLPHHDDGLLRADGGCQEVGLHRGHRAPLDEVSQRDLAQPMTTDDDLWAGSDPGHRGEPLAAVEAQVQPGVGLAERARIGLGAGPDEGQKLLQLTIGLGNRRTLTQAAVLILQEHAVAAVHLDVLDALVLEEGLEPAEPEHRIEDGLSHALFLVDITHGGSGVQRYTRVFVEQVLDDLGATFTLLCGREVLGGGDLGEPS